MPVELFNATRPARPRMVLSQDSLDVSGLRFRFVREHLGGRAEWCYQGPDHVILVLRSGRVRSARVLCANGPRGAVIPAVGAVWVIPAGTRCVAMLEGDSIEYVEISIPAKLLGNAPVRPEVGSVDRFLLELCRRIRRTADTTDPTVRLLREGLASVAILHIRDKYTAERPDRTQHKRMSPRVAREVVAYVEAELASDISLEDLAAVADMPIARFVDEFTEAFAVTPYQFVLRRRMAAAQRLLATTDTPMKDVATAVGFSTPSHFASAFRRRVGLTPSEYRAEFSDASSGDEAVLPRRRPELVLADQAAS